MRAINIPQGVILLATGLLLLVACDGRTSASSEDGQAVAPASPVSLQTLTALPSFTALAQKEGPAVVNISTIRKVKAESSFPVWPATPPDELFNEFLRRFGMGGSPRDFQTQSLGSGFIIDSSGHILTNSHVVEGADEVSVTLLDKREFKAKLIGSDERTDVALLKISAEDLPVVMIGDPSKLEVGEWVVAIGTPFGFSNSLTQGIVSAKGRDLPGENIVPFIQTDAAVNPGNSGGPLFNLNGEVVGINSQIFSHSGGYMGISFAIPIDIAIKVKDELLAHGKVRRGKLGVIIQDLTPELAEAFHLPSAGGALISSIEISGAADRAGLQPGDVVLQYQGKDIGSSAGLARAIADTAPGADVRIKVWRSGAPKEVTVSLGESASGQMEKQTRHGAEPDPLGLSLRDLSVEEKKEYGTEGGIVVEAAGGRAAAAGIRSGDVILALNNTRVTSVEQLRTELARSGKRAALLIQRDRNIRIFIPLGLKEE